MLEVIKWFQANWVQIAQAIAAIIGAASIIVKLTPTLKDDTILLKIVKFLGKYIALNVNTPADVNRPK
jgi:predicted metal-dependent phosphoesterase TrpH